LHPLPTYDQIEQRKLDLCWPWTNPAQKFLIILMIILGLLGLTVLVLSVGVEALLSRLDLPAVSFWLEYVFVLDWSTLRPWHWVGLVVAVTGGAMLWVSGKAVAAYYQAGVDYGQCFNLSS